MAFRRRLVAASTAARVRKRVGELLLQLPKDNGLTAVAVLTLALLFVGRAFAASPQQAVQDILVLEAEVAGKGNAFAAQLRRIDLKTKPAERDALAITTHGHAHGSAGGQQILLLEAQLVPTTVVVEQPSGRLEDPIRTAREQFTQMAGEPPCAPIACPGAQPRKLSVGRIGFGQLVFQCSGEQFFG